jgi:hypothetical protein
VIKVAAAGTPVTGVGGIYYMILFAVSIVLRLYRNSTRDKRKSRIVFFSIVAVYSIVILSILQTFKMINIPETLNYLLTSTMQI